MASECRLEWLKRGQALKAYRLAAHQELSWVARVLGLDLLAYSRMERGLEDPEPAERALWIVSGAAEQEAQREWLNKWSMEQEATDEQ